MGIFQEDFVWKNEGNVATLVFRSRLLGVVRARGSWALRLTESEKEIKTNFI